MASWITDYFPEHTCYVEVFGGGASVLATKEKSKVEVYNDKDGDVVHFFRVLRDSPHELIRWVKSHPYHKDLHEKFGKAYYAGYRPDDDIERAGRFLYLRYSQFAAKYDGYSGFSSSKSRPQGSNTTLRKAAKRVGEFAERFQDITIENRDWRVVFDRFDDEGTFFYCDPPYVSEGGDLYTNNGFSHSEFVSALNDLDGKWLVSYTDLPDGLSSHRVVSREEAQHMRKGQPDMKKDTRIERLVMNYDPKAVDMFKPNNQQGLGVYND